MIIISFVNLSDDEVNERLDYCKEYKLKLELFSVTDMDIGVVNYDTVFYFKFSSEADALIFKLKFSAKVK